MGQPSLYSKLKASLKYSEASLRRTQKGNLGLENGLAVENVDCSCREPLSSIPSTHVGDLQLPVTPDPGGSNISGLHRPLHIGTDRKSVV